MKVIFTDIDGVLAVDGCNDEVIKTKWHDRLYKMCPSCVAVYNEILAETGAEIILSSTWRRKFSLEIMGEIFEWNGIIKTPFAFTPDESISFSNHDKNRIHQIKLSILEHNPEKWVAIDDYFLGTKYYKDGLSNFVHINPLQGLSGSGIKQQILNFLQ